MEKQLLYESMVYTMADSIQIVNGETVEFGSKSGNAQPGSV